MKRTSQTRLTAITILSLLLLLALAVGAQTAAAAHFSNGSAGTTPPAGTEGRGGVVVVAVAPAVAAAETVPGTQGRGGALVLAGSTTLAAGTAGRGGVAELPGASTGASSNSAGTAVTGVGRPRGALPIAQAGGVPEAVASPSPPSTEGWIALGVIAALVAVAGAIVYAASRRRAGRSEAELASYCTNHPNDALCVA